MFRCGASIIFTAILLVTIGLGTQIAKAAEWCPPVEGGASILGFGAAYAGGTHRGVDIAAEPGAEIAAPAMGTVSFAGQVPADGGGTCTAVTLELADGRRMSLLPLQRADVVVGESVEAGQVLGVLAAAGDDSSGTPHVHVSLRSGDLYLDPGSLVIGAADVVTEAAPAAPCPTPESTDGSRGGTSAPTASSAVALATSQGTAPAAVTDSASSMLADVVTESSGVVSMVSRKATMADSGVPAASALDPVSWHSTVRDTPVLAPLDSRALTGTGLACAMVAAAVGIGFSRRAHTVRAN